ncbi:hypothetical protein H5410_050089 [Solanum commersonii]|uniref:Uncharacterized protein n=1 Tax=Solanum commersonii TaxID=4109 RepID=A0A9J5WWZ2_SOLCO|nr:hypothetical protein H5410_050089 [Solanum commersonii]
MSKKSIKTPRKSPRLVGGTSTDKVHPPLDIKHMMHVPQQEDSSKYISNDVFDMHSVDIDSKYHRQGYATILWHYGKIKNEDGTISESEVTRTVASKFGGPRIAKEHVSDTTNFSTPRLRT